MNPGARLGPYEIVSLLGAGGMGEVYRARDTRLQREVAIKVLPASFAHDPTRRARFERETQAVAALSHANILAIFDTGIHDDQLFAVTELLDGETLRDRLAGGAVPRESGDRYRDADRARAGGGAREGHRPSRPEAGERVPRPRRAGEDSRLRAGDDARGVEPCDADVRGDD